MEKFITFNGFKTLAGIRLISTKNTKNRDINLDNRFKTLAGIRLISTEWIEAELWLSPLTEVSKPLRALD